MTIKSNSVRALDGGALLSLAAVASTSAFAAPTFQVNPNSDGLATAGSIFTADAINGISSARIQHTTGNDYSGVGYISFNGFSLAGNSVPVPQDRLGFDYGLYATFSQTFTCSGPLAAGTTCNVDSIQLQLYGDPGNDNTYTQATIGNDGLVNAVGTQVLLGTVNAVINGQAGLDGLGGAFQNVNTNFSLTPEGSAFFISPDPFYSFAYSAFNNTSQGIACNGAPTTCAGATSFAITQETGITDFNATTVPEPASISLLGAGLMAAVAFTRRRKQKRA